MTFCQRDHKPDRSGTSTTPAAVPSGGLDRLLLDGAVLRALLLLRRRPSQTGGEGGQGRGTSASARCIGVRSGIVVSRQLEPMVHPVDTGDGSANVELLKRNIMSRYTPNMITGHFSGSLNAQCLTQLVTGWCYAFSQYFGSVI